MTRREKFERTRPDGVVVVIERDIDTGEQTVTVKAAPVPAGKAAPEPAGKAPDDAPDGTPAGTPSDDWKVPQLKAFAKEHGIDLDGARTKPDILAAILTAGEDDDEDDEDDEDDDLDDDEDDTESDDDVDDTESDDE